jgi:hypothetical protein
VVDEEECAEDGVLRIKPVLIDAWRCLNHRLCSRLGSGNNCTSFLLFY